MESIWDMGIQMALALQSLGGWLTLPMKVFSFLGTEDFFLILLPLLYWSVDSAVGIRVGIILLLSNSVNGLFKFAIHQPRPYWYDTRVTAFAEETSFGIPSGHAQNAVAIWGMLAEGFRRRWLWILSVSLMVLIGISRIYLAVHFVTDVLAGWIIGLLLLWATVKLWNPVASWLKKQSLGMQVFYAFIFSLLLMGLETFPLLFLGDWAMPAEWAANITAAFPESPIPDPLNAAGAVTVGGVLFGFGAALAWINTIGGFKAGGNLTKRALRFIVGLVGVAAIYLGLKLVFPDGDSLIPYIFRYIRYALLGAWISGFAPYLFKKMKLAE